MLTELQRDWHRQGGNGCVFARLAARRGEAAGWRSRVAGDLAQDLAEALHDPDCQVFSLLFPGVTTPTALVELCRHPALLLQHTERVGPLTAVSLRVKVDEEVLAWVMGFGPFPFLPATRQAPVTELVLRTKPKSGWLYAKHSHDRDAAHVADIPLALPEACWDPLWDATHAATRQVLKGEPDVLSAARTTFTVPSELWR